MSCLATTFAVDSIPSPAKIHLPPIIDAEQFLSEPLEIPTELVSGLIHRNSMTMLGGGSKCYKTFTVLDLALSVSQGVRWWGKQVAQGRVLYLNFEIAPAFFQARLYKMAEAKGLERPITNFDVWNLRGFSTDIETLTPLIIERCKDQNYAMIIIDPIYKLMGGRAENSNDEMAGMLNFFETISADCGGAAVVFCHHFTKGLASAKAQIDRVSGGGVFGRHPDGIITLTPHENDDAYVVEATLRNFAPAKPFVLRWMYPLMEMAAELDPQNLKRKAGAKRRYTVADILDCLVDGMNTGAWQAAACETIGLSKSTFALLKKQATDAERVGAKGKEWYREP